jgi:TRAP-type C4-dicarboxylate transport system permease small subunit
MRGMSFVSIQLEQTVLYACLPVGMGLMFVAICVELATLVRRRA